MSSAALPKLLPWESWMLKGACRGLDPDFFHPRRGQATEPAKAICNRCPVQSDCLEYALGNFLKIGVWGGASERERRRIRRERRTAARYGVSIDEARVIVDREIADVLARRAARVLTRPPRKCHCPPDICFCLLQRRRAAEVNGRVAA